MKRAFEPERSWPDAIESDAAERFLDRELGVLVEQGNFEQARQKLARRVIERGDDAHAFLDAIRMERSAAPGGTAWEAWLARALSQGVQVAGALFALVPRADLTAFLANKRVRWAHLEKQQDVAAAHELMRMRLTRQLADDPEGALTALEDPAFVHCAPTDPTLRRFAIGVMTGVVWLELARVFALGPQYGVDWNAQPDARDPEARAVARLLLAFRLQPAWAAATAEVPCPAALERFVRCAELTSAAEAERMARTLGADLRAQRSEYLRCADCVMRSSQALASSWFDSICALRDELAATRSASAPVAAASATEPAPRGPHEATLERCMAKLRSEVRSDPVQRLWPVALVLGAAALALAHSRVGPAAWIASPLALALLPLRKAIDALLYRRSVRPVLFEAIAAHGITLAVLARAVRQAAVPRRNALAARAERDAALALLSAIGELTDAGDATTGQVRS